MRAGQLLPPLPLLAWEPTKNTLHLWAQIVGKVRLLTAPPLNHWWHAPLYVDLGGLTTRRLRRNGVSFQIDLDLLGDTVRVRTDDRRVESFHLADGLSVAAFDRTLHECLARLGVDLELVEVPFGVPMTTPFPQDVEHASYDPEYVHRFWHILDWVDDVFQEFCGWATCKTSPVHLFWHSFDLAATRFSGRPAPVAPDADPVTRQAYSHEVISFGFWPGDPNVREPSFYCYAAPEPPGLTDRPLPGDAVWAPDGGMALLSYEAVRHAPDPRAALLAFLDAAYDAGAITAGWDREAFDSPHRPPRP